MAGIAIVVVSYNTCAHLRDCLASVYAAGATQVVVADNGSSDGSLEMVRSEFPTARLLVDRSNPGYGAAANAGIAHCDADYVLLLNSDTVLRAGALEALHTYMDAHPRAAVVGPRLVNPDGTLQRSIHQFPSPLVTLLDYSWVGWAVGQIPLLRKLYLASDSHTRARVTPWVTGAALAIRKHAFESVGGFDRSYFMYYEEVDLSYRLHRAGWETHFAPVTDVMHVGGASTRQDIGRMAAQQMTAAIRFSERYHSRLAVHATALALRFGLRSRVAGDAVRLRFARDPSRQQQLVEDIATARRVLGEPWTRPTR